MTLCLFRATKPDHAPILLLGTYHKLELSFFSDPVKAILCSSDKLLIERLHFSIPEMIEDYTTMVPKDIFRDKSKPSAFTALNPEEKLLVETTLGGVQGKLKAMGLSLDDLKDELIFGMFAGICTQGEASNSMDVQLRERFRVSGKPVSGLEESRDVLPTIVAMYERYKIFNLLPSEFKKFLLNFMPEETEINTETYLDEYLWTTYDSYGDCGSRNQLWFPKLEAELETTETILIAVGLSHLTIIDYGLLTWFQSRGYTIEQAEPDGTFNPSAWLAQREIISRGGALTSASGLNDNNVEERNVLSTVTSTPFSSSSVSLTSYSIFSDSTDRGENEISIPIMPEKL